MSTAAAALSTSLIPQETPEVVERNKSKRTFFGLGKKRKDGSEKDKDNTRTTPPEENVPNVVNQKAPQLSEFTGVSPMTTTALPRRASTPTRTTTPPRAQSPKSPSRPLHPSGSPILAPRPTTSPHSSPSPPRLSTSSSMIFERNVQEHPNNPQIPASPAIPAHIQTENHIPAVLEASSLAITDRNCDVDEVEIVMHTAHQPAVSVVPPSYNYSSLDHYEDASSYFGEDLASYGAPGFADKRRLSFISFADVVQSEQAEQQFNDALTRSTSPSRGSPVQSAVDPIAISTITERLRGRSPSPIRLGGSPPRANYMGERRPGSPGRNGDSLGIERGELTIETMGQALRRTGSGDLGQRSPIGDSSAFSRTAS